MLDLLGSSEAPNASADTVDTLTNGSFLEVIGVHFWEWLIAASVWAGLSVLALGWMRVARFGPFEWALRSFTHRRWQTLRK